MINNRLNLEDKDAKEIKETKEIKESKDSKDYSSIFNSTNQNRLSLSDVIIPGRQLSPEEVIQEFNQDIPEKKKVIVPARGLRIGWVTSPGTFALGYKMKKSELGMSRNGERIVRRWIFSPRITAGIFAEEIPQNTKCFGAFGKFVVNVPFGSYTKIWDGNTPKLLGPGTHVIKSGNFKYGDLELRDDDDGIIRDDKNTHAEVLQSENYIKHGNNLHILRVPSGKVATVSVDNEPFILESRVEPYVFTTANFIFDKDHDFYDQNAPYIINGTKHRLRIPEGHLACITTGTEKKIIEAGTYEFSNPFTMDDYDEKKHEVRFRTTGDHLIQNGPIKRVLPGINEVAVTNNNGNLEVIDKFKLITEPKHTFVEWVNTSIQTDEFPSQLIKNKRLQDHVPLGEAAFEIFTTRDSLKVGVKILVAYRISNPYLALQKLGSNDGIKEHIEGVVTTDMGKAIQQCTSQEFLASHQTKPLFEEKEQNQNDTYQDIVRKQLAKDLHEYGIELIRMNVQESKIMDPAIAQEISKTVITTATANAKQAIMAQENAVAENKAKQDATVKRIEIERENANKISAAEADLEASRKRASAKIVAAEADAKSILMRAQAEAEASKLQGKVFEDHPQLFEYRKAELSYKAIAESHSRFFIGTKEFNNLLGTTLFGSALKSLPSESKIMELETKKHSIK